MKKIVLTLSILISFSVSSFSATWYVNKNASGMNNGTSWTNAFTDLQAAIAVTSPGDEIWVAAGTYKPTTTTTRTISFNIPSGVSLYGGFNGTETAVSQRNIAANTTILSGDIGQGGLMTDNSYHVVTMTSVSNQTRLDGFSIMNGYASGAVADFERGAGLLNIAGSPQIANCTFSYNYAGYAGAALCHNTSGAISISNCFFNYNNANSFGGAIIIQAGTTNITDCHINDNQASGSGGACYFYGGTINMDRCIISGNLSNGLAGAILNGDYSTVTISNSLLVGNKAQNTAVYYMPPISNPNVHQLINCTIADNNATTTGPNESAIIISSVCAIRNCIVWGNTGTYQITPVSLNISNNIVQGGVSYSGNPVPNNSVTNPSFVSPGANSLAPFNVSGYNYTLNTLSAAIDNGNNSFVQPQWTFDVTKQLRLFGNVVDIGAYEIPYCSFNVSSSPSGTISICNGGTLTLIASPGALTYTWLSINSSGSSANVVGTGQTVGLSFTNAGSYKYVIQGTSINGCRGLDTVNVTVWPNPVPVLYFNSGVLATTVSYGSYQWNFNGSPMPNETNHTFTPTVAGNYSVTVTDTNGCTGTSAPYNYNPTGVDELTESSKLHLYPNPASGYVKLHFNGRAEEDVRLRLVGVNGILIREQALKLSKTNEHFSLDVSNLVKGLYLVELCTSEYKQVEKLVVE